MGIEQICKTISNFFNNVRPAFPQLPKMLLVCSMMRRPGLSTIQSVANITKDLNKLGIPTGAMPDGSANMTVGFAYANIKEIFRAIAKDLNIQGALLPGSLDIVVGGAGGAVGKNVNTGIGKVSFN
jgi:hypothetical protein